MRWRKSWGWEIRPFGIDSVILVPGAFTSGTEHFAELPAPAYPAITQQYGELAKRIDTLGDHHHLHAIDTANGGPLDVSPSGRPQLTYWRCRRASGHRTFLSTASAREPKPLR